MLTVIVFALGFTKVDAVIDSIAPIINAEFNQKHNVLDQDEAIVTRVVDGDTVIVGTGI